MTQDYRKFLQPEVLSRITRLEIRARQVVEGFLSGLHRSPYYGQSVEFVQHREYATGDDIRRVDWKVWSKTDKYYIKLYEEDTNLRTTLLVDLSESMEFQSGPMSKYDYACTVAASLAHLLLKQQDSVGLYSFDDTIRARVPTSSRKNHLHAILQALGKEKPAKKTGMDLILRQVAEEHARKGMIVLISDLLTDRDQLFKGLELLRHRGHDVLVMHLLDDEELDFGYSGTTRFEGMEETGELICDPRSLREGYIEALQNYLHELRRNCARNLIDYQVIRTSEHLDAALLHYFNHRIGMRQGVKR